MNRWITQAVVLGVALSEAAGSPFNLSPGRPSLSHGAPAESDGGVQVPDITFEYLNQCSGANLDRETCLVSTAMDLFGDGYDDDDDGGSDYYSMRRFLEEDGDCSMPEMSEEDVAFIVGAARTQCIESGLSISDQEFDSVVSGFMTVMGADSCLQDLCSGELNTLAYEIFFDEAAKCAQVEVEIPQCLMDQVIELIFLNEGGRRKLLDSTCPSEADIQFWLAMAFDEANVLANCANAGVSVSPEQMQKATNDLAVVFAAQHCFGNDCSHDAHDDDYYHTEDHHTESLNPLSMAVKFVKQCAGLDLDTETCLVSEAIDMAAGPFGVSGQPSGRRRFLQAPDDGGCMPPQVDEADVHLLFEGSRQQCSLKGVEYSPQEFDDTVGDFLDVIGAQECWITLCEEAENPSELMIKIMFEEISKCAGASLDFNPCLLDQIFAMIFSSNNQGLERVRRKLEHTFGSSGNDAASEPCSDQPDDAEMYFLVSLLLAGAQEQCVALGESIGPADINYAASELHTLFMASHCWGVLEGCSDDDSYPHDDDDDYHYYDEKHYDHHDEHKPYLEFLEESTKWMLGQCAEVEDMSCVFSRSLEIIHGMHLGASHHGHLDPQHFAQEFASSICTPPSAHSVYDIDQIAAHAEQDCLAHGWGDVSAAQLSQAVKDLTNLLARPDCWEDLCIPEVGHIIVEEWMNTCAYTDLKFLTDHGQHSMPNDYHSPHHTDDDHADDYYTSYHTDDDHADDYYSPHHADSPLNNDLLRCMASYIATMQGTSDDVQLMCRLPHLGLGYDMCALGMGEEAWIHCNGGDVTSRSPTPSRSWTQAPTPSHSTSPSPSHSASHGPTPKPTPFPTPEPTPSDSHTPLPTMHLSMSFAYDGDFDWLDEMPEMSMSYSYDGSEVHGRRLLDHPPTPEAWYPDYETAWSEAGCIRSTPTQPIPTGRPMYMSQLECCESAYAGQVSGVCMSGLESPPTGPPTVAWHIEQEPLYDAFSGFENGFSMSMPPSDDYLHGHYDDDGDAHGHDDGFSMSMPSNDVQPFDDWVPGHDDDDDDHLPADDWILHDDWYGHDDDDASHGHDGEHLVMIRYIEEVCGLISGLNTDTARQCLKPVCDGLWIEDALRYDDSGTETTHSMSPTAQPSQQVPASTAFPTAAPTTKSPTPPPTATAKPTSAPTSAPTTKAPTKQPTPRPTVPLRGEIEVAFEVGVKLEGLNMTNIDIITDLPKVANLLASVLGDLLPDDAKVRILSIGGIPVSRRLLRYLEVDGTGVDVVFEVVLKKTCSSADCADSEELSETVYQDVTSDLKAQVQSGELTASIQQKAEEADITALSSVSVNASSLQVGDKKVVVTPADPDDDTVIPPDDDSASTRLGVGVAVVVAFASALI